MYTSIKKKTQSSKDWKANKTGVEANLMTGLQRLCQLMMLNRQHQESREQLKTGKTKWKFDEMWIREAETSKVQVAGRQRDRK